MEFLTSIMTLLVDPSAGLFSGDMLLGCTALLFRSAEGDAFAGRTMELSTELPYVVTSIPKGRQFASKVDGHEPLHFTTRFGILAIAVPNETIEDLKILEGLNEKGLTLSVLAFGGASGPRDNTARTRAMLAAVDMGAWILGLCDSAASVKEALSRRAITLTSLAPLHGAVSPFHFIVHDAAGKSLVIEFSGEKQNLYDNPVGVMTNGPEFGWHLTNLGNYTFLNNKDQSTGQFGEFQVAQPDAGIATSGLPASNTSVGRFVRAAYYATYAEKPTNDKAIRTLAHIMNNFDRPKGITINSTSLSGLNIEGMSSGDDGDDEALSEYTSWTVLADLARRQIYIRTYDALNFVRLDLDRLFAAGKMKVAPLQKVSSVPTLDGTDFLLEAVTPGGSQAHPDQPPG